MKDYNKLFKKYLRQKKQLVFTRDDVERILISKFKAREIPNEYMIKLKFHDHLDENYIYKCFVIDDPVILNKWYSAAEKKEHREEIIDNRLDPFDFNQLKTKEDHILTHINIDEHEGRRVNVILESKDGKHVTEFIVRECEKIGRYINALIIAGEIEAGLPTYKEDPEDEYFQWYLDNLEMFGFLD